MLNYKILKNGKIKNIIVSKIHRFEVELILLNSLSTIGTDFSYDKLLRSLTENKSVSETEVLSLKVDARNFICTMMNKTTEKSPVKYSIVCNSSCFNRLNMVKDKENSIFKMKSIISYLFEYEWIPEKDFER